MLKVTPRTLAVDRIDMPSTSIESTSTRFSQDNRFIGYCLLIDYSYYCINRRTFQTKTASMFAVCSG